MLGCIRFIIQAEPYYLCFPSASTLLSLIPSYVTSHIVVPCSLCTSPIPSPRLVFKNWVIRLKVIYLSNFQDLDSKLQRQRILTALTIKWFPRNDSDWFRLPTSGKKKKEVRLLTTFLTRALKSIFSLFFSVCDLMEILYLQLHLVCSCTTLRSTSPLPLTPFSFLFHSRFNPHRSPNLHPLFPPPIPCPQDSFLCLFI